MFSLRFVSHVAAATLLACASGFGQFSSGSSGADGAYAPTVSGDFEIGSLDPDGDNVFHFTTINIPAGVTIRLKGSKLRNQAVTWLASGNVTIAGTLDLSGGTAAQINVGAGNAAVAAARIPADPGPGGYVGGLGARAGVAAETGAGPGGGPVGTGTSLYACAGGSGSFAWAGPLVTTPAGPTYGSYLAIPLYGGSGGAGGNAASGFVGGTGGSGGGAIRIISTTSIQVTGSILANGGSVSRPIGGGCEGGPGSGGTIHLVAPAVSGNGQLQVTGYSPAIGATWSGLMRFSVTSNSWSGSPSIGTGQGQIVVGPLFNPPANSTLTQPSVRITQVNGVNVPANPQGQYLVPDVVIAASTPVTVNVSAANMPLTAAVNLRVTSETGGDQLITCAGLAGTVASSTTTCTATFPFSISISALRATW